jgi:uncharacterized protein (TIGR03067 family)
MITRVRNGWRGIVFIGAVFAALASPTGAVASDAADADADQELKQFEGAWKFVSLSSDGREASKAFLEKASWSIQGGEITTSEPASARIAVKLDPSRSPKEIDLTGADGPGKGRTLKGIYKLENERLTICLPEGEKKFAPDTPRPTGFKGGEGRSLLVLEKRKGE